VFCSEINRRLLFFFRGEESFRDIFLTKLTLSDLNQALSERFAIFYSTGVNLSLGALQMLQPRGKVNDEQIGFAGRCDGLQYAEHSTCKALNRQHQHSHVLRVAYATLGRGSLQQPRLGLRH